MGRKHCGKRRNYSLGTVSPFPTVFSKDLYCRHVKTRDWFGTGLTKPRHTNFQRANKFLSLGHFENICRRQFKFLSNDNKRMETREGEV